MNLLNLKKLTKLKVLIKEIKIKNIFSTLCSTNNNNFIFNKELTNLPLFIKEDLDKKKIIE